MRLTCYVDADHARDKLTRRSVTGIILLVNKHPCHMDIQATEDSRNLDIWLRARSIKNRS